MSGITISGGANLKALLQTVANQRADVKAGFFEGRKYPDGTAVAYVAAIQEFGEVIDAKSGGTITIPARPFMQGAIDKNHSNWSKIFTKQSSEQLANGGFNLKQIFNVLGMVVAGDIKDSIVQGNWKQNAASTVARKRKDTPLRDTMVMLQSVEYEVSDSRFIESETQQGVWINSKG